MKSILLIVIFAAVALAVDQRLIQNSGFQKFGEYNSVSHGQVTKKTYWYSKRYPADWITAKTICNSFYMKMLTLETEDEQAYFLNRAGHEDIQLEEISHIGAFSNTPKSTSDWYWVEKGRKVGYSLSFTSGEPNYASENELCLGVGKKDGRYGFYDIRCSGQQYRFFCESY